MASATYFLIKMLPRFAIEMAPHVLAYNLTQVINIMGAAHVGDECIAGSNSHDSQKINVAELLS